jgi:D-threo-aldose 1-dehydrogenase
MSSLARVPVGSLPLHTTRLAFGSAPLASQFWGNDEATAIAAVSAAVEAGIAWFDTAPLYGSGEAEARVGAALRHSPADVVIATKVGRRVVESPDGPTSVFDFSRDGTLRSLEESLGRLGRDRVDVVHVHDPDDHLAQAFDECLPALMGLRAEGVITAVSVGTMQCDTALAILRAADPDLVMIANRLTLLDHSALDELVPACEQRGVPLLAAAVFNSGLLARPDPGVWFDYAPASHDLIERARSIARVCESFGVPLRAAAMQYPLRFAPVCSVVVGMADAAQVVDNVAAMSAPIPDELWAALDQLTAG